MRKTIDAKKSAGIAERAKLLQLLSEPRVRPDGKTIIEYLCTCKHNTEDHLRERYNASCSHSGCECACFKQANVVMRTSTQTEWEGELARRSRTAARPAKATRRGV
jgi:hypothetical protein